MKYSLLTIVSFVCFSGISQTDIFTTDFQTGIPLNYTLVDNDGLIPASQVSEYTSAWITVLDPENPLDTIAASTSYFSPAGTANRWLITAPFALGSFGNFIEWEAKSQDAAVPDDYLVLVSSTDNQITSFTDTVGYIIEENFEWTTRTVNLSDYGFNNQTIYIAFVNVTNDGFKLYIDDIHAWENDPVSVDELSQNSSISIYPNPSSGIFTISSTQKIQKVQVLNSLGQVTFETNQTTIDLENYSNGIYFLNIETDLGFKTLKVLKN
ncbi:MAG: hypothetical protein RI883_75 [Bacteroidota bacterium]|jgi:hypothetical protein